jgi:hypothetical protein
MTDNVESPTNVADNTQTQNTAPDNAAANDVKVEVKDESSVKSNASKKEANSYDGVNSYPKELPQELADCYDLKQGKLVESKVIEKFKAYEDKNLELEKEKLHARQVVSRGVNVPERAEDYVKGLAIKKDIGEYIESAPDLKADLIDLANFAKDKCLTKGQYQALVEREAIKHYKGNDREIWQQSQVEKIRSSIGSDDVSSFLKEINNTIQDNTNLSPKAKEAFVKSMSQDNKVAADTLLLVKELLVNTEMDKVKKGNINYTSPVNVNAKSEEYYKSEIMNAYNKKDWNRYDSLLVEYTESKK